MVAEFIYRETSMLFHALKSLNLGLLPRLKPSIEHTNTDTRYLELFQITCFNPETAQSNMPE